MKSTLLILASYLLLTAPVQAQPDATEDACFSQSTSVLVGEVRQWGGHCIGFGYTLHDPAILCDSTDRVCHADHVFEPPPASAGSCTTPYHEDVVLWWDVRVYRGFCTGVEMEQRQDGEPMYCYNPSDPPCYLRVVVPTH